MKGFVECANCLVWAEIPVDFKETKHFAQCPKCKKPMYLIRSLGPKEVGLREDKKVVVGLMSQKGY